MVRQRFPTFSIDNKPRNLRAVTPILDKRKTQKTIGRRRIGEKKYYYEIIVGLQVAVAI